MQTRPKRILLIEEDYVYFLFFREILSPKYEIERAVSIDDMEGFLKSESGFDFFIYNATTSCNNPVELEGICQVLNEYNSLVVVDTQCYDMVDKISESQLFLSHTIADVIYIDEMIEELLKEPLSLSPN